MDKEWKSTEPFYLEGHGDKKRICLLLIHGFTGNPGDCRRLGLYLNREGYSVQAIRLPGHGTTPEDMSDTRWEDWWKHTLVSFDLLQGLDPERIIVPVGYSMGGLLAMRLSLERQVAGIVSLAAPIFICDRRVRYAGIVKYFKPYIHKQPIVSDCLVMERGAYSKTPLACVESLYKNIRIVKKELSYVHAPLFIGQGEKDGTVRPESAAYIHRMAASRKKSLRYYPDMTHAIMTDAARERVFEDVLSFVSGLDDVKQTAGAGQMSPVEKRKDAVSKAYADGIVKPTMV